MKKPLSTRENDRPSRQRKQAQRRVDTDADNEGGLMGMFAATDETLRPQSSTRGRNRLRQNKSLSNTVVVVPPKSSKAKAVQPLSRITQKSIQEQTQEDLDDLDDGQVDENSEDQTSDLDISELSCTLNSSCRVSQKETSNPRTSFNCGPSPHSTESSQSDNQVTDSECSSDSDTDSSSRQDGSIEIESTTDSDMVPRTPASVMSSQEDDRTSSCQNDDGDDDEEEEEKSTSMSSKRNMEKKYENIMIDSNNEVRIKDGDEEVSDDDEEDDDDVVLEGDDEYSPDDDDDDTETEGEEDEDYELIENHEDDIICTKGASRGETSKQNMDKQITSIDSDHPESPRAEFPTEDEHDDDETISDHGFDDSIEGGSMSEVEDDIDATVATIDNEATDLSRQDKDAIPVHHLDDDVPVVNTIESDESRCHDATDILDKIDAVQTEINNESNNSETGNLRKTSEEDQILLEKCAPHEEEIIVSPRVLSTEDLDIKGHEIVQNSVSHEMTETAQSSKPKGVTSDTEDLTALTESNENEENDAVHEMIEPTRRPVIENIRSEVENPTAPVKPQFEIQEASENVAIEKHSERENLVATTPKSVRYGTRQTKQILTESVELGEGPKRALHRGASKVDNSRRSMIVKPGKWTLGSQIGHGAFGVVHIGMNTETGRLMAVKSIQMDKAALKDLRREIDLMNSLKHENIVQYFGCQQDRGYLRIFQEWVAGGSVTELLSKFGVFTSDVTQTYISQMLAGLSYLHENNIVRSGENSLLTSMSNSLTHHLLVSCSVVTP